MPPVPDLHRQGRSGRLGRLRPLHLRGRSGRLGRWVPGSPAVPEDPEWPLGPHWPHRSPFPPRGPRGPGGPGGPGGPIASGRPLPITASHTRSCQRSLGVPSCRSSPVDRSCRSSLPSDLPEISGSSIYAEGGFAVRPCAAKYRRLCATAADCGRTSAARSFQAQACFGSPNLSQQTHRPSAGA